MNRQNIADALDKAIATVAEQEFNRLCRDLNDVQVAEQVAKALDELAKLQGRGSPDYNNEWVVLFYVTWYQPRQINVALAILQQLYEEPLRELAGAVYPVEIIDVGCGALSVQFATAIAATQHQQHQHTAVSVHGIDPSHPMKRIGETLWSEFCAIIVEYPDLSDLSNMCNLMTEDCDLFDSFDSYRSAYPETLGPNSLLLAVHVVYDSNQLDIQQTLQNFHTIRPVFPMFVACHKDKRDIAEFVIGGHDSCLILEPKDLPLQGVVPKTTEWRERLLDLLPEGSLGNRDFFLTREVKWAVLGLPTLVYRKEGK